MSHAVTTAFDPIELRRAYGTFPSGVTAVCGLDGNQPFGMAASSFTSVSLDPPLVSVCFDNSSRTLAKISGTDRVGLSVLTEGQGPLCRSLSSSGERFSDIEWTATGDAVFIGDAAAWLECSVYADMPAGDHRLVLFRVHSFTVDSTREPLVFHSSRFRQLEAS